MRLPSNNLVKITLKEIDYRMSKIELLAVNLKRDSNKQDFQKIQRELIDIEQELKFLAKNKTQQNVIFELLNQLQIIRNIIEST